MRSLMIALLVFAGCAHSKSTIKADAKAENGRAPVVTASVQVEISR
jgi:hypothetical protein